MQRNEIAKGMKKLEYGYNKKFAVKEQVDLWFEVFEPWSIEEFDKAILKTLKENQFFPTIADVWGKREEDTKIRM